MLVCLYALQRNDTWTWHLTLDARVDNRFWRERRYASYGIAVLEPAVSYGQAVELLRELSVGRASTVEDGLAYLGDSYPDLKWRIVAREGEQEAGLEADQEQDQQVNQQADQEQDRQIDQEADREQDRQIDQEGFKEDPAFYLAFVRSMSGRQLLFEEILSLGQHIASKMVGQATLLETHGTKMSDESVGSLAQVTHETMKAYIQLALLRGDVSLASGMRKSMKRKRFAWWKKQLQLTCRRCGSGMERMHVTHCATCGDMCPYCEGCLTMGRVRRCSMLVRGSAGGNGLSEEREENQQHQVAGAAALGQESSRNDAYRQWIDPWGLSPAQTEAAREGLQWIASVMDGQARDGMLEDKPDKPAIGRSLGEGKPKVHLSTRIGHSRPTVLDDRRNFLIWAVTGAGKTEMIFPFIGYTLARGGKVLIATPRRDVVLELRPRIMRAFPEAAAVTLYGGSEERWDAGPIVIATTHQLMRFHEAFDLVIVDELDAFPYHGDPQLQFAARGACKPGGCTLLLSATPPPELRRAAVRGELPHVRVPARYHGRALPVPRQLAIPPLPRMLKAGRKPPALAAALAASLARGAQLFVFVPSISSVEPVVRWLRRSTALAEAAQASASNAAAEDRPLVDALVIEGTSSQDPQRAERVQRFRDGEIRVLVTTTILERGVTVPKTDVFILGTDSRLFDEAALVQMSGRAGRSVQDPEGHVYFAAAERTKAQSAAIAHIKQMNRLARLKGFLRD